MLTKADDEKPRRRVETKRQRRLLNILARMLAIDPNYESRRVS